MAQHPTVRRTDITTKNDRAQNVKSARDEKLLSSLIVRVPPFGSEGSVSRLHGFRVCVQYKDKTLLELLVFSSLFLLSHDLPLALSTICSILF